MVLLKAKYASDRLRHLRTDLDHQGPNADWYRDTHALLMQVFEHRKDLASSYAHNWPSEPRPDIEPKGLKESLDVIINALNPADELLFAKQPAVILTLAGVLFLIAMAGGTVLYYMLFLSG